MADPLKMKKALFEISTEEENKEYAALELAELNSSISKLEDSIRGGAKSEDLIKMVETLSKGFDRLRAVSSKQSELTIETFKEMQKELVGGLKGLEKVLEAAKSKKTDKFYDDFYASVLELNGYSKRTSELITNLKWNSFMHVEDSNGTPINPSVAPFNLTKPYDYISLGYTGSNLTTVQYYNGGASGQLVGTLTLAYSGSNLVSVTRT